MIQMDLFYAIMEIELADGQAVAVGELREMYGMPRATLHRYLKELVRRGFIFRASRGKYAVDCMGLHSGIVAIYENRGVQLSPLFSPLKAA